jgi:hypothetical protein
MRRLKTQFDCCATEENRISRVFLLGVGDIYCPLLLLKHKSKNIIKYIYCIKIFKKVLWIVTWSLSYKHRVGMNYHHHHKHQGLGHLARSISRVTAALASVSSFSQLFSFLVDCSGMILKGFGFVAFFAGARAGSFCIYLFCLVCIQSAVRGVWSRL